MSEPVTEIANRIRELRESNEMSSEWAARALGVTVDELNSYESGEDDIPVSFLYMAAKKYGVDLSTLLTGENPHDRMFSLVRKGEGVHAERCSAYQYQSLCATFMHKSMEPLLVTVEPKPPNDEPHFNTHSGQEFQYLLEGQLRVTIQDQELDLNPGDSLIFNSEYPHCLKALGDKPAKILVIIV
ncbi:helix-turn-helix transcriptional regulator [candidate division KSB1 bacterium]|nr:helix-turn-helix transcriptional regulator [candidate division KSB1 bacterium]